MRAKIDIDKLKHLPTSEDMLEKGETDMQLSTFLMVTNALGLKFSLTY